MLSSCFVLTSHGDLGLFLFDKLTDWIKELARNVFKPISTDALIFNKQGAKAKSDHHFVSEHFPVLSI